MQNSKSRSPSLVLGLSALEFFFLAADENAASAFNDTLKTCGPRMLASKQIKNEDCYSYEVTLCGRKARHEPLVQNFLKSPDVKELHYYGCASFFSKYLS